MQVKEEAIDRILAIEQEVNRECQPMYRERAEAMSRIPNFWKFVLMQHGLLQNFIMEDDQDVLDYLEQVCCHLLVKACILFHAWLGNDLAQCIAVIASTSRRSTPSMKAQDRQYNGISLG